MSNDRVDTLREVDGACYCKDCTGRTRQFYKLHAYCVNCGTNFILKIRKGDKPSLGQECPACGVSYVCHTKGLANAG